MTPPSVACALLLVLLYQGAAPVAAAGARTPGGAPAPARANPGGAAAAPAEAPPANLGYTVVAGVGYYKAHAEKLTWSEAAAACAADNGHLLIVTSNKEAAAVRPLLARLPPDASNELHAGFLRPDYFVSVFGSPLSTLGYQRWAPGQQLQPQVCGSVNRDALLYDAKCSDKRSFLCEYRKDAAQTLKAPDGLPTVVPVPEERAPFKPSMVAPPTGYELLVQQGRAHYYSLPQTAGKLRWSQAKARCERDGAHLLLLNHQMEANTLKEHVKKFKGLTDDLYVGLRNGDNRFFTVFGNSLASIYSQWESEQPDDETCLAVDHNMLLKKVPCWEEKNFICEMTLV